MNARQILQSNADEENDHVTTAWGSLDALLAEAVKIFGHGHENPDSVSACPECAWMIKAMKLGYGQEDK